MSLSPRTSVISNAAPLIAAQPSMSPRLSVVPAVRQSIAPEGVQNRSLMAQDSRLEKFEGVASVATGLIGVAEVGFSLASKFNPDNVPLDGISDVGQGLEIIGTTLDAGINTFRFIRNTKNDIKAHSERKELHALLKDYDPTAHNLTDDDLKRASELANKEGGNRLKSSGDAALDRLVELKRIAISGQEAVTSTMKLVGLEDPPYLSLAFDSALVVDAGWKLANTSTALTNLRQAVKNSEGSPVLLALANHIENERIFKGRTDIFQGSLAVAKVGFQATSLIIGGPAGLMIGGAIAGATAGAVGAAMIGRGVAHAMRVDKKRDAAEESFVSLQDTLHTEETGQKLRADIGLAERAMLHMLRNGSDSERSQAAKFLTDFGIKKETIFGLRVMDEKGAAIQLTRVLYKERVKSPGFFKSLFSASNWKSFGQIIGLRSRSHRSIEIQLKNVSPNAAQSLRGSLLGSTASVPISPELQKRQSMEMPVDDVIPSSDRSIASGSFIGSLEVDVSSEKDGIGEFDFSNVKAQPRRSVALPNLLPFGLGGADYRYALALEREVKNEMEQRGISNEAKQAKASAESVPVNPPADERVEPAIVESEPIGPELEAVSDPIVDVPVAPVDQPPVAATVDDTFGLSELFNEEENPPNP